MLDIRAMSRPEVDTLVDWAATEGWNPGLDDAELFWANDPQAFVAAEQSGELVGGGAITAYGNAFGFMGFFIMRPAFRGRGLGNVLWHARLDRLRARLMPGATIGLDGVFNMQAYYARGGFVFSHRNLRFQGRAGQPGAPQPDIVDARALPLADIAAYDRTCFPADRTAFLARWLSAPAASGRALVRDGRVAGFGVIRRCREGAKVGPLFADDLPAARSLWQALAPFAAGNPICLDVPENNPASMALVAELQLTEVFGCARMYLGAPPDLQHDRVFGVTTFEVG
ncbi:MAG: GNAT family N-acetyltransferase [Gammaproteobacteria bacterium]